MSCSCTFESLDMPRNKVELSWTVKKIKIIIIKQQLMDDRNLIAITKNNTCHLLHDAVTHLRAEAQSTHENCKWSRYRLWCQV